MHRRSLAKVPDVDYVSVMNDPLCIRVVIRNEDGAYLAGGPDGWEFTQDRSKARVFDYLRDRVAEQLSLIEEADGKSWVAVRLDPREAYEVCDRCGARVMSFKAYFDGKEFFCPACRSAARVDPVPAADDH